MNEAHESTCPGCGIVLVPGAGFPTHPQSVAVHLMTLAMVIEDEYESNDVRRHRANVPLPVRHPPVVVPLA